MPCASGCGQKMPHANSLLVFHLLISYVTSVKSPFKFESTKKEPIPSLVETDESVSFIIFQFLKPFLMFSIFFIISVDNFVSMLSNRRGKLDSLKSPNGWGKLDSWESPSLPSLTNFAWFEGTAKLKITKNKAEIKRNGNTPILV